MDNSVQVGQNYREMGMASAVPIFFSGGRDSYRNDPHNSHAHHQGENAGTVYFRPD